VTKTVTRLTQGGLSANQAVAGAHRAEFRNDRRSEAQKTNRRNVVASSNQHRSRDPTFHFPGEPAY
jgi:hypothetical protein